MYQIAAESPHKSGLDVIAGGYRYDKLVSRKSILSLAHVFTFHFYFIVLLGNLVNLFSRSPKPEACWSGRTDTW